MSNKSNQQNNPLDYIGQVHNIVLQQILDDKGYQNSNIQSKARKVVRFTENELKAMNLPLILDENINGNNTFLRSAEGMGILVEYLNETFVKINEDDLVLFYLESVNQFKSAFSAIDENKISPDFDVLVNEILDIVITKEFNNKEEVLIELNKVVDNLQDNKSIEGIQKDFLLGAFSTTYHSADFWIDSDEDVIAPACGWCKRVLADVGGFMGGFALVLGVNEVLDESWNPFSFGVVTATASSGAVSGGGD